VKFSFYLRRVAILAPLFAGLALQNYAAQETAATTTADPRSVLTFGEKLKVRGIPNAGKVNDTLYRGAQPRALGYQQLKDLGVAIVVDLRNTGPKSPERGTVEAFGNALREYRYERLLWSERQRGGHIPETDPRQSKTKNICPLLLR
jgi:hypothetical protein